VATAFLATENPRGIMGYTDLWALKAILRVEQQNTNASKAAGGMFANYPRKYWAFIE
jgi:hypothetical protein